MGNIHGIISDKLSLSKDEFSVSNLNSAIACIISFQCCTVIRKGFILWNGHLHAINCENITLPPFGSAVNNI